LLQPLSSHAHFGSLKELFINEMSLDWAQVERLEPGLPSLKELHVRSNELLTLSAGGPVRGFSNLRLLDLEYNFLEWSSILQLAHLESLEVLMLNANNISVISPLPAGAFPHLRALSLDKNQISQWDSIVALQDFPKLHDLKLRENPIHKGQEDVHIRSHTPC